MAISRPLLCFLVFFLLLVLQINGLIVSHEKAENQSFQIDYTRNTFLKDEQPFRYVSGSFHYSRVHPDYWKDRLLKTRAAGVNAIQTIVPWNIHELSSGKFTWTGFADLPKFLSLAKETDLIVLLRLGPYICGEWEFGGFPAWLLTANSSMILRTSDPSYMVYVDRWYSALLDKVKPFMYDNGGPVVMVQIENEYGSYFACDSVYLDYLRDKVVAALTNSSVLYTTDGGATGYLKCGKVEDVYATVDFGTSSNFVTAFKAQRQYEPKGPLVNSEFYTGWLDHWGEKHSTVDAVTLAKYLDSLLNYSANVNMYMFVGGTNFGFTSGANDQPYLPVPTSYDYDSPISEAGDLTPKYYAVRDIISKYLPLPKIPIPPDVPKAKYGKIPMTFVTTVQDSLHFLTPEGPYKSKYPVNMEKINFYHGFILYRTILKSDTKRPSILSARGVRDRAIVMVNAVPFGLLEREKTIDVNITGSKGQAVDILVENCGRINYGSKMLFNTKGIIENVILDGEIVTDWEIYPLHLENINNTLAVMKKIGKRVQPKVSADGKLMTPSIYLGSFEIKDQPNDTFLDPTTWGKGQAIINDFNLGRYWPGRGPQVTLYVPAPVLVPAPRTNYLFLFETESAPCGQGYQQASACQVNFTDVPCIDGPIGPGAFGHDNKNLQYYNDPEKHLHH
ncbi:beta-galactosidase [Plakobranchus ocellatus]|uniref:Beta-galactosidase n=1 Tax=Plakobranchus ocellatus TaxID=259542 RepID=A0AAV4A6Z9_9GAST|nr:beta-galactosidase [Plakobranchus ocellatus]